MSTTTDDEQAAPDKRLDTIGHAFSKERDAAVQHREQAGFDALWKLCEDNYAGLDELSRLEAAIIKPRYEKSMVVDGPLTGGETKKKSSRATAFLRLTARYVDAGKAKLAEILLPANDKAYAIKPTPIPTLALVKENLEPLTFPAGHPMAGQPMLRDPKPEELAPPNPADPLLPPTPDPTQPPSQMEGVPITGKDLAEEKEDLAAKKAKKAEKQIDDWFVEGRYRAKMRRVLFFMTKLGVGIIKAPTPEDRRSTALKMEDVLDTAGQKTGATRIIIDRLSKIAPGFKVVSPWDFYPDPSCGDDIQEGSHVWERDRLSERKLKKLKTLPGYLPAMIDAAVQEGPNKSKEGKRPEDYNAEDQRYTVWYRTGTITKEQAEDLNGFLNKGKDDLLALPTDQDEVMVSITLINERVIRCIKHTLDSGEFNYHAIPWQYRDDSWIGVGVAEQLIMPQALITATIRAMINNAGAASGPQIVIDKNLIEPENDSHEITPFKLWLKKESAAVDDIRKAFGIFSIPSEIQTLMQLAEFAFRLAEESTSIPLITQGQSGETTPQTLGGMQLQNNNANQLLRDVANNVDDYGTEPIVTKFHEHLLLDPDVPDDAKGDHQIDAHGSIVLVERAIQNQFIASLGAVVKDPAFGINPKKWIRELMAANYYDPDKIQYTEDEQRKLASVPPPQDPRIVAAKLQSDTTLKKTQMELQAQSQQHQDEHNVELQKLSLQLEDMKRSLAEVTLKLQTQIRLSQQDRAHQDRQRMAGEVENARDRAAQGFEKDRDRQHQGAESAKDRQHQGEEGARNRGAQGFEKAQDRAHATAQALAPPTEPAGRAPNGEAFQK